MGLTGCDMGPPSAHLGPQAQQVRAHVSTMKKGAGKSEDLLFQTSLRTSGTMSLGPLVEAKAEKQGRGGWWEGGREGVEPAC